MPWYEASRNLARLLRIRRENEAGRMVAGLGARNVPWARAHAGPLGADVSGYKGVVSAADQAAFAQKQAAQFDNRYGSYETADVRLARMEAQMERFRNLSRKSGADAPLRPGAATGAETLRQRLAKRGFGIESEGIKLGPIQWTRAGLQINTAFMRSANRFGGRLFAASVFTQVAAGGLGAAAAAVEQFRTVSDPVEAAKAGGLNFARSVRDTIGGAFALDDIAASVATILGITNTRDEARRKQQSFYDDLFTTGEEKARRAKARNDQLSAMYAEVNKSAGEMWAKVNSTLPSSFSLRKNDLFQFRAELNRVNAVAIDVLHDMKRDEAARAIEAGDVSGG